jgi:hypothetical protein
LAALRDKRKTWSKKELQIVEHLRRVIGADKTRLKYRVNETDFTRQRKLTFAIVTVLILRGHKFSLQNALNKFFGALGKVFAVPTDSAYCHARQKLQPAVFVELNRVTCQDFYRLSRADNEVLTWRGHRVLGYDGTYLNLPDTAELRQSFSVQRNQHGAESVQALAGVLYDLRNDLGLAGALSKIQAEKNLLFEELWAATQPGDLLVMDRNFADYAVIALAAQHGRAVLIRCPTQCFGVVNDFWQSDATEALVTLTLPQSAKTQRYVRAHGLPETVQVRLLKFTLVTGETEVLLTTLCDQRRYPRAEFEQVYGWRWGCETYYDRVKNIFEVERFSGFSETAIRQDFHGVIFLATLESVLVKRPQAALTERDRKRQSKTPALVNRAVSYVTLLDRVAQLLADPHASPETTLAEIQHLLQTNPTRNRAGRKFERKKLKHAQKLRYHRYRKRVTA